MDIGNKPTEAQSTEMNTGDDIKVVEGQNNREHLDENK